jgi:hypothetical protein
MNAYQEVQTSGNNWVPPALDLQYGSIQELPTRSTPRPYAAVFECLENQMAAFALEHEGFLQQIRKHFVLPADSSVTTFLTEHRSIPQTLVEAVGHLKECFGADTVFRLGTTADEAGLRTLHIAVIWPGRVVDARTALAKFDDWWLDRVRPGAGYLTFTYELV